MSRPRARRSGRGSDAPLWLHPIGVIHTPFQHARGTPIQPPLAAGAEGWIHLRPRYVRGLQDLAGFERLWLLYWCDRAAPARLRVTPYLDRRPHGVFATRAPSRPNAIGLSAVRLLAVEGARLRVADVDMLDGTPLLDIKPYLPDFDAFLGCRTGWYRRPRAAVEADGRFERAGLRREPGKPAPRRPVAGGGPGAGSARARRRPRVRTRLAEAATRTVA